jgi:CHAT domain-containing protein
MRYFKLCFGLQVFFLLWLASVCCAQSAAQNESIPLKLNVPVEGNVTPDKMRTFSVHLESNQFAFFVLEQKDAWLELILDDAASGQTLVQMSANYGSFGYERILLVNDAAPRDFVVKINRFDNDNGKGNFSLVLSELRTANANDKTRFAAQDLFTKALKVGRESGKESQQQSILFYEYALKLARESGDKTLEVSISAMLQIAYEIRGDYKKSFATGSAALALLNENEESFDYARIKYALGYDSVNMGEAQRGVGLLLEVLPKIRQIGDRVLEVKTLNTLSYGYLRVNKNAQSIETARQALELAKSFNEKTSQNTALLNLSYVYDLQGDFAEAVKYLNIALPIALESKNRSMISRLYSQLGSEYYSLGQIQKALDYHLQSLNIRRELGERQSEAIALANIAQDYSAMGQNLRALEYNRQAVQIFNELGNKEALIRGLTTTGSIYLALKDSLKAKEAFNEGLKIAEGGNFDSTTAVLYHSLGVAENSLKNYQAAIDNYKKAAEIRRRLKQKRLEATSLGSMSDNYLFLKKYEEAWAAGTEALEISRTVGDRRTESNALYTLAYAKRFQNDKDLNAALAFIKDSIKIVESLRADLVSRENRASYLSTARYKYDFYVGLLIELEKQTGDKKYLAEAFAASERARARSLLDSIAESYTDISTGISPELKSREQSVHAKLSTLQMQLIRLKSAEKLDQSRIADLQKDIDRTDDEREQIELEIRRTNPRYAALKYPTTLNLAQTQATLDDRTVLLEYQTGLNTGFLFAVSKNDLQIVRLPSEKNLRASIESLRESISVPTRLGLSNYLVKGRELYQTLLAPVEPLLKNKTKIIVSADGALNYLPFEVLLKNNQDASLDKLPFLVRDFEISYTPSASVLANLNSGENADAPKPAKSFLAFAAPDYGTKTENRNQFVSQNTKAVFGDDRSWDLTDLPNAAVEAERISKLFPAGQSKVFLGAQATEEQAKTNELLSQYRYLHFAVHGLIDEEQPQFSSLVLSLPKNTGENKIQSVTDQNPKSEIQNPKSQEDGLLQTPEIYNLRLRADLVTLSACETGLGKEMRGEGIIGLTRAFFYAGTPSVLVSLWKVNDASTADLMTSFYEQLGKNNGRSKAAALRQAQLKLIAENKYSHPYYWAPFVIQGKSDSKF